MMKLLALVLIFPFLAGAHTSLDCESQARKLPSLETVINKYKVIGAQNTDYIKRSEVEVKRFWRGGWPEMKRIAQESGTSLSDILRSYYDNMIFIQENLAEFDPRHKSAEEHLVSHREGLTKAIAQLEMLGPKDNLKRRHWEAVGVVYSAIFKMMGLVTHYLAGYGDIRRESPVDPFAPYTADQIHATFDQLEILTLDRILNYTIFLTRNAERRQLTQLMATPAPASFVQPGSEAVIPVPRVQEAQGSQDIDDTGISAVDQTDLATVLKMDLPLRVNETYFATTVRQENLKIQLEEDLVSEDHGADGLVVRRLLRSIITANQSTGVVMLKEVGPKIVEVRAVMRGAHKRIIGCLDGRDLTLKFLIDIRASGETYARRINSHLCQ